MSSDGSSEPRDARGDRLLIPIALFKLFDALLLLGVAAGAHHLLGGDAREILLRWAHAVRVDPDARIAHAVISKVTGLSPKRLEAVGFATAGYGLLHATEAIGLLMRRRWAEWLTVVSTGVFLPVEVYELIHHATIAKAAVLVANVLVVIYLIARLVKQRRPAPSAV